MENLASLVSVYIEEVTFTRGYWEKSHYISRGATGYWSKYGGKTKNIIEKAVGSLWYCQSCGTPQSATLPPFKVEFIPGEYIRICASCFKDRLQTS